MNWIDSAKEFKLKTTIDRGPESQTSNIYKLDTSITSPSTVGYHTMHPRNLDPEGRLRVVESGIPIQKRRFRVAKNLESVPTTKKMDRPRIWQIKIVARTALGVQDNSVNHLNNRCLAVTIN